MRIFDLLRSSCYYVTGDLLKSFLIRLQQVKSNGGNINFIKFISKLYDIRSKKGSGSKVSPVLYDLYASGMLYVIASSFKGPNSQSLVNLNLLMIKDLNRMKKNYIKASSPLISIPFQETSKFIPRYFDVITSFLKLVAMDFGTDANVLIAFIESHSEWFDFAVSSVRETSSEANVTTPYTITGINQLSNQLLSQGKKMNIYSALDSLLNLRILQGTNFKNGIFNNSQSFAFTDHNNNLFISQPNK